MIGVDAAGYDYMKACFGRAWQEIVLGRAILSSMTIHKP
jgi:hypothetical protein